jgi:glycosyltransferase involved in cell wall biosynthesis
MKKIFVAIPCNGDVDMSTTKSLINMFGYTLGLKAGYNLCVEFLQSSVLPQSRISLVKMALEGGYDYILFIDADMKFPPNLLERLLAADVDVITTNYVTKSEEYSKCTSLDLEGKNLYTTPDKKGIEEIAMAATGTMLIKTELFKNLAEPWFIFYWENETKRMFGEDYYFCHIARQAGYKVYIDHDLSREVFHIGRKEYKIDQALKCKELYEQQQQNRTDGNNN